MNENSCGNSMSFKSELREYLVLVSAAGVSLYLFMQLNHWELCVCGQSLNGTVLGCKIIPSVMTKLSFCVLLGVPSRNIGGLGEGNKGANLAEVPVKDGRCHRSDTALCAFLLLAIREKKKRIFENYFYVFSQIYFSAVWGLVLML